MWRSVALVEAVVTGTEWESNSTLPCIRNRSGSSSTVSLRDVTCEPHLLPASIVCTPCPNGQTDRNCDRHHPYSPCARRCRYLADVEPGTSCEVEKHGFPMTLRPYPSAPSTSTSLLCTTLSRPVNSSIVSSERSRSVFAARATCVYLSGTTRRSFLTARSLLMSPSPYISSFCNRAERRSVKSSMSSPGRNTRRSHTCRSS